MILLALDTSEKSQGLALAEDDKILAERELDRPSSHSEDLLINLKELLQDCSLSFDRVDAIAVTVGPGSFTGLRIALSTVKGLAVARQLPIIPVGTLIALAAPYLEDHSWVAPCLDARMNQVYAAVYARPHGVLGLQEPQAPKAMELIEFTNIISKLGEGGVLVGSGLAAYPSLGKSVKSDPSARVRPSWLLQLAYERYKNGQILAGRDLQPDYLRLSTPEVRLLERSWVSAKKP